MRRWFVLWLATLSACGSAPAEPPRRPRASPAAPATAVTPPAPLTAAAPTAEPPRVPAPPPEAPPAGPARSIRLAAVHGARSLFAVSDWADRDDGVVRRYDGASDAWGPALPLAGEHFVAGLDRADGRFYLLTSTVHTLCVGLYAPDGAAPERRSCAPVAPKAFALVGERIALVETTARSLGAAKAKAPSPGGGPKATKTPKKSGKAASSGPPAKKKTRKQREAQEKASPKPHAAPAKAKTKTEVDVAVRWIDETGRFDDAPTAAGLTFERAMEGLDVIDAAARGDGFDLLWYEAGLPPKVSQGVPRAGALGWGRITGAFLDAKGQFDPTSRKELNRGPLEWGHVEGARLPRFAPFRTHPWLVTLAGRGAQCEASSLLGGGPALLSKTLCSTLPPLLGGTPAEAMAYLDAATAEVPEKAPGERRDGFGFVTWAGGRGFYLANGKLRSVSLDAPPRDEPWPLHFETAPPEEAPLAASAPPAKRGPCSADMVSIRGSFCIDRYESQLVDPATGVALSPDYPTTPNLLRFALGEGWTLREALGDVHGRAFPMPSLPLWQLGKTLEPKAVARKGVRPQGYVTGIVAEAACAAAGKRLCTEDEFVMACRGERDTQFPYGADYVDGACNVFREDHPATLLHENPSLGHLDPRLDRVPGRKGPLLRATGESPRCASPWGDDAVYDLVGNLDEWLDDPAGAFAGGFFARSTRNGCDAFVGAHPKSYLDYSTGVRCCGDAR
jgi:sulfatase modifying factor 1